VFWLCRIAQSLLAILRQPIANQAMAIWRSHIAKKAKVIWVIFYHLIYAGDLAKNNR
jgi:hypothetical protein